MSSIRVSRTVLGFVLFALAVIALLLFSSVRIAGARAAGAQLVYVDGAGG
ncbi:MAG TPA: hypothetical protein VMQ63_08185 [Stellaceae bacterium]|nr:hypothetical protein [Stellaceae bacterium]